MLPLIRPSSHLKYCGTLMLKATCCTKTISPDPWSLYNIHETGLSPKLMTYEKCFVPES